MTTEMTPETAEALRAPFPADEIGKLPRVTCAACRDKTCQQHSRQRCETCRNFISTAHIHLDYVGHAEVTDRLLDIDPHWTWEPVAWRDDGLPAYDNLGGLWVRLTIAGVTRLGYGHADGKRTGDAMKEIIGDAIRNAAMRFGVALDLWRRTQAEPEDPAEATQPEDPAEATRRSIARIAQAKGYALSDIAQDFTERMSGADIRTATQAVLAEYLAWLRSAPDYEPATQGAADAG